MPLSFRLATFNLENLDDRPGLDPPLSLRIDVLRRQLLRLEADVLCLQEVNSQHPKGGGPRALLALDRLLDGTPYAAFERAVTEARGGTGPADVHNLVLLSRYPIVGSRSLRHGLVAAPRYRTATARPAETEAVPVEWDRPILQAEIALPGALSSGPPGCRRLHVLNLHLRAPLAAPVAGQKQSPLSWRTTAGWAEGFFLATVKRSGQALDARLLIESLFDREPEALIAVLGDFNAKQREMPLRILCAGPDDTGNPDLAARRLIDLSDRLPAARRFTVLHGGQPALLDHLLASPSLACLVDSVEAHNEALRDEAVNGDRSLPGSHHAPLVAAFSLPGSD